MKVSRFVTTLLVVPAVLAGQTPAVKKAATSLTEADVKSRIFLIADDSMGGRDTPSKGLDQTAQWVASEFKRLGLKPGGDSGSYIQHYQVNVSSPDPDSSFLQFTTGTTTGPKLQVGTDVQIVQGAPSRTLATMDVVLIGGATIDTAAIPAALVKDRLAILVADWSHGMPEVQGPAFALISRGVRAVMLTVNSDSMAGQMGLGLPPTPKVALGPPRPSAASTGGRFLALVTERALIGALPQAAEQFQKMRASTTTLVVPVTGAQAVMMGKIGEAKAMMAPNTVGILEGTDPRLKSEYVIVSAHMDHVGGACAGSTPADRICNGADDDGSGTVGVVGLAEAFAQAPPKRSMIFLTVSGEEKGLWGSDYFANHPPVPIRSVVADLNIDMIGRNWKDTVVAIGKEHSDLGATADRIAASHPELGMKIVDDLWPKENLYSRSDHFNFAQKGIPILFFTSGLHPDYHAVTDSPDKIDYEKEARILQLIFYLGQEVANGEAPRWNPESYKRIVPRQNQVP